MQGARRGPWWLPRASRATPQTPLSLPTLRDRADFPSLVVVASSLGLDPTTSAPPRLRGNMPRSRPREILRQAPPRSGRLSLIEGARADVGVVAFAARLAIAPIGGDFVITPIRARILILIDVVPGIFRER